MSIRALLLLASLLLAGLAACTPPQPRGDGAFSAETVRADLKALYEGLQQSHYDLFARRPRAEYDALYQQLRSGVQAPLNGDQVRILFQRFLAYGNVAHSRTELPVASWETFRNHGGKAFPLRLRVEGNRVVVLDNLHQIGGIAMGDVVEQIQGEPVLSWLARPRELISADNDYLAYTLLEDSIGELLWYLQGEVDSFPVRLRTADGAARSVIVPAQDRAQLDAARQAQAANGTTQWQTRELRMLDAGIAYLRPGPFYDNSPDTANMWDPAHFQEFIDASFQRILEGNVQRLIIDLRNNPGGDSSFSDPLLAWIADRPFQFARSFDLRVSEAAITSNQARLEATRDAPNPTSVLLAAAYRGRALGDSVAFPIPVIQPRAAPRYTGKVFVLVNRYSFSNTVFVAATIQDEGFGTILGEETADLASTYGAMESFVLPATAISIQFPKARIVRANGDVRARGVIPDVEITTELSAGAQDLVMAKAMQWIARANGQSSHPGQSGK